jgi:hypothetical protein
VPENGILVDEVGGDVLEINTLLGYLCLGAGLGLSDALGGVKCERIIVIFWGLFQHRIIKIIWKLLNLIANHYS